MPENKTCRIKTVLKTPELRARLFFVASVFVTLIFVVFNAATGIVYRSMWYGSVAIYYTMLTVQKAGLVLAGHAINKKFADDAPTATRKLTKLYLANGIFLVVLDIALAAAIIQWTLIDSPGSASMVIAIATAAYCFFKIIFASINAVKGKNSGDTVLRIINNMTFAGAVVSMLALTATMVGTFGDFDELRALLIAVAALAELIILSLGIFMTVTGAMKLSACRPSQAEK